MHAIMFAELYNTAASAAATTATNSGATRLYFSVHAHMPTDMHTAGRPASGSASYIASGNGGLLLLPTNMHANMLTNMRHEPAATN